MELNMIKKHKEKFNTRKVELD